MTVPKPTADELGERLGVRLGDLPWRTSGHGDGMFAVAVVRAGERTWALVRLHGAPGVQVYDEREWTCFLDGVRRGEFDDLL